MIRRCELPLFLTGFLATLSGVGLARFAYTALMPQMVLAGWFTGEQAAYLGAANLLGYLVGALGASALADRLGTVRVLVLCWWAVALSFAGCSMAQPMPVFMAWRLLAGVAGAMLMVLGPSVAMAATPPGRRAALGPAMFSGVGAGALLSATLVPSLAQWHLGAVWWALAVVCLIVLWWGARSARQISPGAPPDATEQPAERADHAIPVGGATLWRLPVILVLLAYACDGFGFVAHTVFWVDHLARELGLGTAYGATQWAFFGLGALLGPLCASLCAQAWGWWRTTTGAYALKALAIGMPLLVGGFAGHAVSGFIVGMLSPGMSAITSGYLMQLIGPAQHKRLWGYATAAFALLQATSGYAMASIYASTGSYRSLFALGAAALALGTLLVALSRLAQNDRGEPAL